MVGVHPIRQPKGLQHASLQGFSNYGILHGLWKSVHNDGIARLADSNAARRCACAYADLQPGRDESPRIDYLRLGAVSCLPLALAKLG